MIASVSEIGVVRAGSPVKLALQVLADCVAVSMIVLLSAGLLPGQVPGVLHGVVSDGVGKLLVEVWLYTIMIATPAHWALPRLYPFVAGKRRVVQWAMFVVVLAAISICSSVVASAVVHASGLEPGVSFSAIASFSVRLALYLALLIGIIHASVLMLRERLDAAKAALRAREIDYERARKLAAEARLAALEARVHPHFFFNALNTVSSLIPTAPERAERLIERISALLRFSLDVHDERGVPLGEEMRIVQGYLDIEQARFGDRLRYSLEVSPQAALSRVPPLSVQTLVENSVKHAVGPARKGAEIRVRAVRRGDSVHVEVADSGAGFRLAHITSGHGLDNLRSRLAVQFEDPMPLAVERDNGWTKVSFRVPA